MKDWRLIYIIFAKSEDKLYISNKIGKLICAAFGLHYLCAYQLKNCNVMFDKETYVQRRALLKKILAPECYYSWEMTNKD